MKKQTNSKPNESLFNTVVIGEFDKTNLGNRDVVRANSQRGEDIIQIELEKIVIRLKPDGSRFNGRDIFEDIEELAMSILENGQTNPGRVDVLNDGRFALVDGERRFRALKYLESLGHKPFFKAIVNKGTTTEEERIIQMFTSQDSKPLKPFEVANVFAQLVNLGWSPTQIAKKLGKTDSYVSQMLSFWRESEDVKELVKQGKTTVSAVLATKKIIPSRSDRARVIKEAVDHKTIEAPEKEPPTTDEKDALIKEEDKSVVNDATDEIPSGTPTVVKNTPAKKKQKATASDIAKAAGFDKRKAKANTIAADLIERFGLNVSLEDFEQAIYTLL